MECQYCGGHCTIYDGGEANNCELAVYVCDECDMWQDEDDDEPVRSEDAEDRYRLRFG